MRWPGSSWARVRVRIGLGKGPPAAPALAPLRRKTRLGSPARLPGQRRGRRARAARASRWRRAGRPTATAPPAGEKRVRMRIKASKNQRADWQCKSVSGKRSWKRDSNSGHLPLQACIREEPRSEGWRYGNKWMLIIIRLRLHQRERAAVGMRTIRIHESSQSEVITCCISKRAAVGMRMVQVRMRIHALNNRSPYCGGQKANAPVVL